MIYKNISCLVLIILFLAACETEVDILDSNKEVYSLNCILNKDSTLQYATVTKNYYVENNEPTGNTISPFVKNVEITITDESENQYQFVEATKPFDETSRYSGDMTYYYLENFQPEGRKTYSVSAKISETDFLTAETTVPGYTYFLFNKYEETYPGSQDYFSATWQFVNATQERYIFKPTLRVHYFYDAGDSIIHKTKVFPEKYINVSDGIVPVLPAARGYANIFIDEPDMLKSFQSIAGSDAETWRYLISHLELEVKIFDEALGAYYMLNMLPEDGFTVILDYLDYTNIENGRGVFGSIVTETQRIEVAEMYVKDLGYRLYEPDN